MFFFFFADQHHLHGISQVSERGWNNEGESKIQNSPIIPNGKVDWRCVAERIVFA
jgi:hypothetical protein